MISDKDILEFWFGKLQSERDFPNEKSEFWFAKDMAFDTEIREKFSSFFEHARKDQLKHWRSTPKGTLALIILLDQFNRNIHRGKAEMFQDDKLALKICLDGLAEGYDLKLYPIERAFFYLPLEHTEDRQLQEANVNRFIQLLQNSPPELKGIMNGFLDYAIRHKEVIDKFGRFPHRNIILGRDSTEDEKVFLQQPGSHF